MGLREAIAEAQRQQEPDGVSIATGETTPEKLAAFRAKVARVQGQGKRELAVRALFPRERRFAADLTRFFKQARWITVLRQFPDGRPLKAQTAWQLEMWSLFIQAIEGRMMGAGVSGGE